MASMRLLRSDRELKAYLHRTRMRIVAEMRRGADTVTKLGERMGVHPANLSRHVRTLEKAGLIQRLPSEGGVEKFYQPTADVFEVSPDASAHEAGDAIALNLARSDLAAAAARVGAGDTRVSTAFLARSNVSQDQARALVGDLLALVERFKASENAEGEAYHLNLSLYPGGVWDGPKGPIMLTRDDEQ